MCVIFFLFNRVLQGFVLRPSMLSHTLISHAVILYQWNTHCKPNVTNCPSVKMPHLLQNKSNAQFTCFKTSHSRALIPYYFIKRWAQRCSLWPCQRNKLIALHIQNIKFDRKNSDCGRNLWEGKYTMEVNRCRDGLHSLLSYGSCSTTHFWIIYCSALMCGRYEWDERLGW